MALVLIGSLVTFDPACAEALDGAIYVDDNGVIEAVLPADAAAPVGYEGARRVASRGVVYPGLIDLHNHLAYNWRPLWPPPQAEPYTSRSQWPDGPAYESAIRTPTAVMGKGRAPWPAQVRRGQGHSRRGDCHPGLGQAQGRL